MAARRFFLSKALIQSGDAVITGPDARHIQRVLRLKPGDRLMVYDGEGGEYDCKIIEETSGSVSLLPLNMRNADRESPVRITLGQSLMKGEKNDWIVQKLAELGISAFIPFISERSILNLDNNRAVLRADRWRRIGREASKQCGRRLDLEIKPISSLDDVLHIKETYAVKIIFSTNYDPLALKEFLPKIAGSHSVIALIGPEGGFADNEIKSALECGYVAVSLGPRTLRGETAAIVAAGILQFAVGDIGYPTTLPEIKNSVKIPPC
ncbi:MAG: 16S rRNA (uracil(1498)-N(3))-methyltransferase [Pseudomonadota bacterium]